jgi:hypothetical protein
MERPAVGSAHHHRAAVTDRCACADAGVAAPAPAEVELHDNNLGTIIARRWANGAVTALVLVGAGLAALLLPVLGYGATARSTRSTARSGSGSIVILAALVVCALVVESALLTRELPRLLAGARP